MTRLPQLDAASAPALLEGIKPALTSVAKARFVKADALGRTLLLTGGSGFLGAHVLGALAQSSAFERIYVLVRDCSKLSAQFTRYGLPREVLARLQVIEGDLLRVPLETLPDADVVLHSAALIHGLHPLERLWDNVRTTLRLCERYGPATKLVFISSLSVFVSSNVTGAHLPLPLPVTADFKLIGGYAQSKYLGEKLIEARAGHIVRPGLLTGSSFCGVFPERDFFALFLRALSQLGCYPKGFVEAYVDITPVDFAAQRLTSYLERMMASEVDPIYHIANRQSLALSTLVAKLQLREVPKEKFFHLVSELPRLTQILLRYAFFKSEALAQYPQYFNIDLFQSTGHSYAIEVPFPVSNALLLKRYCQTLL